MAKNTRECPALGVAIPSARCGEERGSVVTCPAGCEFNPFGRQNYDQFGEVEGRVIEKLTKRHAADASFDEFDRLSRAVARHRGDAFLVHAQFTRVYHREPDATGRTFTQRWEVSHFAGLNNDERQILRWMGGTRLCLIEIHRQLDEYTVEVVDLLDADPQPFLIVDRALAGCWGRFTTVLSWCYATPHYQRIAGGAREVQEVGEATPAGAIGAIVAHLGGPAVLTEAREWMTENIVRVVASLDASVKAAYEAMLRGFDARFGKARYRWSGPTARAAVEKKLRAAPDIEAADLSHEDAGQGWEGSFDVFERRLVTPAQPELGLAPATPRGPGEPLVGSVLVGPHGMVAQAATGARFAELKHRVEKLAGGSVVFDSERVDDLAAQLRGRKKLDYDPALVPPALLAEPRPIAFSTTRVPADGRGPEEMASDYQRQYYRTFADLPVPALGGCTPRQAAADPALRQDLLNLMKGHLTALDRKSQDEGAVFDLDWLLRDLGLEEILFPPPPLRERSADEDDLDDDDEGDSNGDEIDEEGFSDGEEPESAFDDDEWDHDPTVVELPAPGRVLSSADVRQRVGRLIGAMNAQELDFLVPTFQAWPGVGELCTEVAAAMTFEETAVLVSHFLQVAWLLHPVPPTGARLHPGRLLHYFDLECDALGAIAENRSQVFSAEALIGETPQPSVVEWIVSVTFGEMEEPGRKRPRDEPAKLRIEAVFTMVCMLKAAVREFCHWPVK